MEAMASGLSCVVSKIRGNVDLIDVNECLVMSGDVDRLGKAIACMTPSKRIGQRNMNSVRKFNVISVEDK